jgi:hypothetical protein
MYEYAKANHPFKIPMDSIIDQNAAESVDLEELWELASDVVESLIERKALGVGDLQASFVRDGAPIEEQHPLVGRLLRSWKRH